MRQEFWQAQGTANRSMYVCIGNLMSREALMLGQSNKSRLTTTLHIHQGNPTLRRKREQINNHYCILTGGGGELEGKGTISCCRLQGGEGPQQGDRNYLEGKNPNTTMFRKCCITASQSKGGGRNSTKKGTENRAKSERSNHELEQRSISHSR